MVGVMLFVVMGVLFTPTSTGTYIMASDIPMPDELV